MEGKILETDELNNRRVKMAKMAYIRMNRRVKMANSSLGRKFHMNGKGRSLNIEVFLVY